jgi:prepilin-type N-terminal cleavage/methylation domain-containing protein/prepilin-type processing-associated H-X9-DG protein
MHFTIFATDNGESGNHSSQEAAMRPSPHHHAFTLIELLVVISIIAILAGMLIPTVSIVLAKARQMACGRSQSQVVVAMMAYSGEHDGAWPMLYAKADGTNAGRATTGNPPAAPAGTDATVSAIASQELLASWSDGDLTRLVFRCAAFKDVCPATEADLGLAGSGSTAATWISPQVSAFAYDWSVPSNAKSVRVVLCDRPGADGSTHGRSINAVYADGHLGTLTVQRSAPTGTATMASDGNASTISAVNADAGDTPAVDGVFDGNGDGSLTGLGGRGSRSRSWAR